MSRAARIAWTLLGALALAGCSGFGALPSVSALGPGAAAEAPAQVAIEVYRGAPTPEPEGELSAEGEADLPVGALAPARFEVWVADGIGPAEEGERVASGEVGSGAVRVPSGFVTVAIKLVPQELIGPFFLAPGASAMVRLLDFPAARPPTRTWRVERAGEPVGRAFPPPETLPWVEEIAE